MSTGRQVVVTVPEDVPEEIRARLHARFPKGKRWLPPPPAWTVIREVLEQARADGLNDVQTAGGIYTVLVARGLISEGRA
jgi:hypothetical protein